MGRTKNRKNHKKSKRLRKKKLAKNNKKTKEHKNTRYTEILEKIERITDEFGRTIRNISLIIKIKKKPIKMPKIKQNIARQRISNFRMHQYKEELLEKARSFKY